MECGALLCTVQYAACVGAWQTAESRQSTLPVTGVQTPDDTIRRAFMRAFIAVFLDRLPCLYTPGFRQQVLCS